MSVVDRHCFDADPNLHVDADRDPDGHQKDTDPHADPTLKVSHIVKIRKFILFLFTSVPLYNDFPLSRVANVL
jgi:hypothetical protein